MIVEELQMIVAAAFPDTQLPPGFTHEQIAAAEARLNVVLPEPLKDYFTVAGGSRDLMDVNYRMLPPEKLRIDGDHLIFCAEDQGLEDYGIPLDQLAKPAEFPNPSVRMRPQGRQMWGMEASATSAFLLGMGAWQAVLALDETARCKLPRKQLKQLLAFFEPVGDTDVRVGGPYWGLVDRKNAIVAAYVLSTEMLYVGSASDTALEELAEKSGLDFESL
jgi:hypothetical protein